MACSMTYSRETQHTASCIVISAKLIFMPCVSATALFLDQHRLFGLPQIADTLILPMSVHDVVSDTHHRARETHHLAER